MKKLALLIFTLLFAQNVIFASPTVFNENGNFGLKDENSNVIVNAKYKKMIRLGESGWIIQNRNKFGIMNDVGTIIVEPKFDKADRVLGKYAKLTKGSKVGLFNERGENILPVNYSSIDLLFGGMFLTCKNYKYGVSSIKGETILENVFDDIYMPKPNIMMITYNGHQYEIQRISGVEMEFPENIASIQEDNNFKITEIIQKPAAATGYYSVSATNYFIKIFSSISPAYEETIDELMFSRGADAAGVIMKFTWLPKFPFVYAKKYYQNLVAPNNGPLSEVKSNLKQQIKN